MSVEFDIVESNFKYLLILLRDDLPLADARKFALKCKTFAAVLGTVQKRISKKVSDPELIREFGKIMVEADALREERNLMLHSIWVATADPEKPLLRMKEDESDPEVDFDVQTVQQLVDRMIKFRDRAYAFFCRAIVGYAELPATLYDSKGPGS
jgi:hypothetical protein